MTSGVAKENKLNTEKYMVKASAALITAKNIEFIEKASVASGKAPRKNYIYVL